MAVTGAPSTPLADFVAGAGSSNADGERLRQIGALVGVGGVVVAVG